MAFLIRALCFFIIYIIHKMDKESMPILGDLCYNIGKMRSLWTDGSASPNPGPGGFSVIEDGKPVVLGKEKETSNIKMEGAALKAALLLLDGEEAEIHTDSEFWIKTLTEWAPKWKQANWTKKKGEIKNLELVKETYDLYEKSKAKLIWVRGHVGTEMNEIADEWANKAREGATL